MPTYICLLTIWVHVVYMGTRSFRENIQFFKIWMFPKIVGFFPPNHPLRNRVFHLKKTSILGYHLFLERPICLLTTIGTVV